MGLSVRDWGPHLALPNNQFAGWLYLATLLLSLYYVLRDLTLSNGISTRQGFLTFSGSPCCLACMLAG